MCRKILNTDVQGVPPKKNSNSALNLKQRSGVLGHPVYQHLIVCFTAIK